MRTFLCKVCGHVEFDAAPETCPVCRAPKTSFEEKFNLLKMKGDGAVGGETEKKHVPQIVVVKKCGLIPEGCTDVHIKVGEIEHPMTKEHAIQFIDCYLSKKYLSRIYLTPEQLHPAAALHLKAGAGIFSAIENCNLHGLWLSETNL
jgi:desulfoferrodoxin-like iron-binding protein